VNESTSTPLSDAIPAIETTNQRARWFVDEVYTHDAQLKAYLRGSFPSIRDVEDVAQESYSRVWRIRASQSIRSARGILFQIARHVATDLQRRDRTSPLESGKELAALTALDHRPNAAEATCTREEIALLADAIEALPSRCQEIFIMRKLQRIPQKEIARQLGISEQTVQGLVFRGMKRCEAFLSRRGL
jgi:RNA polymerase sigma-70 factor (ECF subfamily)